MRATGTPKELADRLGVSEKTVYGLITDMKEVWTGDFLLPRAEELLLHKISSPVPWFFDEGDRGGLYESDE